MDYVQCSIVNTCQNNIDTSKNGQGEDISPPSSLKCEYMSLYINFSVWVWSIVIVLLPWVLSFFAGHPRAYIQACLQLLKTSSRSLTLFIYYFVLTLYAVADELPGRQNSWQDALYTIHTVVLWRIIKDENQNSYDKSGIKHLTNQVTEPTDIENRRL